MRSTLPTLFALASLSLRLTAQEPILVDTALTQVRLHPSEAWVTRAGHVRFTKPGNYRLRVAHLPEGLTLDDLRVQARGPEGTSLGEIRVGKEAAAGEEAPETKAMKAKLDALNLRKAALESEEKAAAESMKLLGAYEDAVAKGSTQSLPGGSAVVESSRQLELRFRELMAQSDARA
ncbi:MAG TPA: DUF4140 domain-containing protein, partial [Holophagaceae bacterium]|nr:DUF4140 domain-containing protein [Holophagaceae bacterium]